VVRSTATRRRGCKNVGSIAVVHVNSVRGVPVNQPPTHSQAPKRIDEDDGGSSKRKRA